MNFKYAQDLPSWFTNVSDKSYFEDCLSRLDNAATAATVSLLSPGRSGAAVILVRRVADGETLIPLVAKIANDSSLIRKERDGYEGYVKDRLANAPALIFSSERMLVYTYTGMLQGTPLSFREGYSRVSTSTLKRLLGRLVEVLVRWYVPSNDSETNVEQMVLDPPLSQVLKDLGPDFSEYDFLGQWWEQFLRFGPQNSVQRVFRCHGDLNAGNVTFDGNSIDPIPFLIDFASISKCITHWDFAKLDRDLKTRLYLGDAQRNDRTFEQMAAVVQAVDLAQESNPDETLAAHESEPDQKVMACVQALRSKVLYMDGSYLFERAYYQSLVFATLQILYRKDPDPEDVHNYQKKLACVSVTALLSRLLERSIPQALDYIEEAPSVPQIETFEEGFKGVTRLHLSAGSFLQMICERITACSSAEVRFVGITAYALFTDPNFIKALSDQTSDDRFLTLHVYLLKADSSSLKDFCQRSSEPMDVLRQKLQMTRTAMDALSSSEDHKKLRLVLYEYEALPTINLVQINNEFFFRPYKIGEKLPFLNVYNVKRNGQNEDVESWLDNVLNDLTLRSDIHTIKWNSSLGAPWTR